VPAAAPLFCPLLSFCVTWDESLSRSGACIRK
jgi:hypothetical protein